MPIFNHIDALSIVNENWKEQYKLAFEVLQLQKDLDFIKQEFYSLLSTLSIESNREHIRNGEGIDQLFDIVDTISKKIKEYKGE